MSDQPAFGEEAASDYDVMVDWDARLAREVPFFRELLEDAGARRVVDLGCGTAKHAIEFARLGLEVIGVDPSESMLEQAKRNALAAGVELDLRLGGYGELAGMLDEPADAILSLGNAFIHVEGPPGAAVAIADIAAALKPGGLLVLHFLNHQRLLAQRPRTMPARFRETPAGDRVFLRVIDYPPEGIALDFITLSRGEDGEWQATTRHSLHVALPVDAVVDALGAAGFEGVRAFGSHDGAEFDAERDESVILVARRS